MRKHIHHLLLPCLISLILLSGCAGLFKGPSLDVSQMTIDELRDRIEQNHLAFQTLQGKGTISSQMPGMANEASISVKIIMPDSLVLKVEAMFGIDVGTFSSNRSKFALYSPMQKVLYTGRLDSLDLAKFFQVDITYDELMEALIGTPKIETGEMSPLELKDNKYLLTSVTEAGVHRYRIHPTKFVVEKYQFFDRQGTLQIIKEFSRFEKFNKIYLPKVIQIQKPVKQQVFALYYTQRKLNKPISKKAFKIRVPKKTRHIRF